MKFQNPSFNFFLKARTHTCTDGRTIRKQYAPHFFKVGGIIIQHAVELKDLPRVCLAPQYKGSKIIYCKSNNPWMTINSFSKKMTYSLDDKPLYVMYIPPSLETCSLMSRFRPASTFGV